MKINALCMPESLPDANKLCIRCIERKTVLTTEACLLLCRGCAVYPVFSAEVQIKCFLWESLPRGVSESIKQCGK